MTLGVAQVSVGSVCKDTMPQRVARLLNDEERVDECARHIGRVLQEIGLPRDVSRWGTGDWMTFGMKYNGARRYGRVLQAAYMLVGVCRGSNLESRQSTGLLRCKT
jgi:hypothetical protein